MITATQIYPEAEVTILKFIVLYSALIILIGVIFATYYAVVKAISSKQGWTFQKLHTLMSNYFRLLVKFILHMAFLALMIWLLEWLFSLLKHPQAEKT